MDSLNNSSGDLIATEHERVYYLSEGDRWNRGEVALAEFIADHLPGWNVIISMGPYRSHDICYKVLPDERVIRLDIHSPALVVYGPDVPHRPKHPIIAHAESIVHGIVEDIKAAMDDDESPESG